MTQIQKLTRRIIFFSFLSASIANAQEIDLSRGWKFKTGDDLAWSATSLNDADWKPIEVNNHWEAQGYENYNGYAWYRLRFALPSSIKANSLLKDSLRILLGRIDDGDQTFLNGKLIGQNGGLTGPFEGNKVAYGKHRRYSISVSDPAILWDKENVLAVRVNDHLGNGGLYDGPYAVGMVDVIDNIKFDPLMEPFNFPDENNVTKKIVIKNLSETLSFSGKLTIQTVDKISKNFNQEKVINATLSPKTNFTYEVSFPRMEGGEIIYTFTEQTSNNSIKLKQDIPFILTPKESANPRINGARVFGVRPGSDFLYTIAATGIRPMAFEAKNLPAGLKLDAKTGIISGKTKTKGEYKVTLSATNALGKATRELKISVGEQIALTPPMGWNSWNCWGLSVSDEKVRSAADAMKSNGMINHGWSYVNIDDGWEDKRNEKGEILANSKFPNMKGLSDYVHAQGLKIGIYSSPGPRTCGEFIGSYQHEAQDAKTYGDWGIDYLKYDWCFYSEIAPTPDLDALKKPYKVMSDALANVNRDIVYSLCQYGWGDVWKWGNEVKGQLWRTTGDIEDTWNSMAAIGFKQDQSSAYAKPGNWNDPDMLVVGRVGWGPSLHQSRLTPDEQYTHISLWAMLSAPLLTGCDMSKLDKFTLSLLTNDEVIDIDQDPLGKQATKAVKNKDYEIWVKNLSDGSKAVALFNLSDEPIRKIKLSWSDINVTGQKTIRDVWRQANIGKFDKTFETNVSRHGVVLLRVY